MPLDPQAKDLLDQVAAANLPLVPSLTPSEARSLTRIASSTIGRPPDVGRLEDLTIPGPAGPIRARLSAPAKSGVYPALVYFHGGGWVLCDLDSHDVLCRAITNAADIAVIAVDYRLAPEHPFPAAIDDAFAATSWIVANARSLGIDPARIAVGGDSAGGNLAAVVARRARDRGGPPLAFQLLIYPVTDANLDTPSYLENAQGYLLTREAMIWYWNHYVPDPAMRADPDASPLRARSLAGLPPALILTAEYDPLRDEAEAYARRLAEAGVPTRLSRYPGAIHDFLRRYVQLDQGKAALAEVAEALREALGAKP
ncbi:MAG: alpha/beta hydrolase [Isosphaeraceae bacterium]